MISGAMRTHGVDIEVIGGRGEMADHQRQGGNKAAQPGSWVDRNHGEDWQGGRTLGSIYWCTSSRIERLRCVKPNRNENR